MPDNETENIKVSKANMSLARTYKRVFDTKDGKRILADMLTFSRSDQDVFYQGKPDETAYYLGMQRVVKRVTGFIEMDDQTALRIVRSQEVTVNE